MFARDAIVLNHLDRMNDSTGLIQHAIEESLCDHGSEPERRNH